jgi:hypothetical protein
VRQGARLRVATKFVQTAREHFAKKGVHVDLIKLYGSMELAPLVGLSDAIVDVVSAPAIRCAPTTWSKSKRSWTSRRAWWSTRPRSSSSASACNPSSKHSNAPPKSKHHVDSNHASSIPPKPISKSSSHPAGVRSEHRRRHRVRRRGILADVKARGDAAVLEYTNRFDRIPNGGAASMAAFDIPQANCRRRWRRFRKRSAKRCRPPRSASACSTSARSRN